MIEDWLPQNFKILNQYIHIQTISKKFKHTTNLARCLKMNPCIVGYHSKGRFCIRMEGIFTSANFDSLLKAKKLIFDHEIFVMTYSLC